MSKKRPVNLNLMTIKFPVAAISSILHRASGLLLFLLLPFVLWALAASLSAEGLVKLQPFSPVLKFIAWVLLSGLIYHLIAGVRHLLMDAGWFEDQKSGPIVAWVVLVISVLLVIAVGVWLLCK